MTAHPDRRGAGLREARLEHAARHAARLSLVRAQEERVALERALRARQARQQRTETAILLVGCAVVAALALAVAFVVLEGGAHA